ncbi:MAG: zf-TFIIB domain-containing protein [Gemmatimonadetes bacterium]|nr:zf-TFIIB domain-containing protein [Gemmatimonadota bacterium]
MSELTHKLSHQPWSKPSRNEEEYFHREEFHHRMEKARRREASRSAEERERLRELHWGRCPRCGAKLEAIRMAQGTAQQCPACLGVWLERETFDLLTHPEGKDDYLTGVFREVLLLYTTGSIVAGGGGE